MIWRCPKCRKGVEGPANAEESNPCRLCPGCSLRLGYLVHRKKGRRTKKVPKQNPRLQYMWMGFDLRGELHRLLEFCPPKLHVRPPSLILKHQSTEPRYVGWANYTSNWIKVILWPRCPVAFTLGTLVHELAHFVAMPEEENHGDAWRMAMIELVRDGYGMEPAMPKDETFRALDEVVENALADWVAMRDRKEI